MIYTGDGGALHNGIRNNGFSMPALRPAVIETDQPFEFFGLAVDPLRVLGVCSYGRQAGPLN